MSEILETFKFAQKTFDARYSKYYRVEDRKDETYVLYKDHECFYDKIDFAFVKKHINDDLIIPPLSTQFIITFLKVNNAQLVEHPEFRKYLEYIDGFEEIKKKLKEEEDKKKCQYVFQKGRDTGERCPQKKIGILDFCDKHIGRN